VAWNDAEDLVDPIVEAIQRSASTGRIGDGKVFVLEMAAPTRSKERKT
jgi:nitrogen regulatory protein P-II 2